MLEALNTKAWHSASQTIITFMALKTYLLCKTTMNGNTKIRKVKANKTRYTSSAYATKVTRL